MTCTACDGCGLVPFVECENPKPDDAITAEDLWFALCLCERGQDLRRTTNAGRSTDFALWHVWAAREHVDPARVCRLEEVFSADELRAAGFGLATPAVVTREAALLALGRSRGPRL